MRRSKLSAFACALGFVSISGSAVAAPAHDLCADLGSTIGFGMSSYGAAEGWVEEAQTLGVSWDYLYFYVLPAETTLEEMSSFIQFKGRIAASIDSTLVITFYDLLNRGKAAGFTQRSGADNAEADVVQQTLEDPELMRSYFDAYITALKAAATVETKVLIDVEPDSWGFMMWAMGMEGRGDASSIMAHVVSSEHPDLADSALPNDAGGLGRALVYLRDKYAPEVQLGWHASNFRNGMRPEVVNDFYSSMGDWDVIITEHPHINANDQSWWEPLNDESIERNIQWVSSISTAAALPVLFWQMPIGPFDYHLMTNDEGRDILSRFMNAGVIGMMWEHSGNGDADAFRALNFGTPPADSPAGGTAKDLRDRILAFQADPLPWPENSPCADGSEPEPPGNAGAGGEAAQPSTGGSNGGGGRASNAGRAGAANNPAAGEGGESSEAGGTSAMPNGGGTNPGGGATSAEGGTTSPNTNGGELAGPNAGSTVGGAGGIGGGGPKQWPVGPSTSSDDGCAWSRQASSSGAWPLLGLLPLAAWARRRRKPLSPSENASDRRRQSR